MELAGPLGHSPRNHAIVHYRRNFFGEFPRQFAKNAFVKLTGTLVENGDAVFFASLKISFLNETSGHIMAPASFPCTGCVTFSIACEYSVPTGVTEAWPQSFWGLLPP